MILLLNSMSGWLKGQYQLNVFGEMSICSTIEIACLIMQNEFLNKYIRNKADFYL